MARGKPFTPGKSGNPSGRPVGRGLKAEIEAELAEPRAGYIDRATMIARKLVDLAEDGDVRAIELLLKRVWPERLSLEHDVTPVLRLVDRSDAPRELDPELVAHAQEGMALVSAAVPPHQRVSVLPAPNPASSELIDLRGTPRDLEAEPHAIQHLREQSEPRAGESDGPPLAPIPSPEPVLLLRRPTQDFQDAAD